MRVVKLIHLHFRANEAQIRNQFRRVECVGVQCEKHRCAPSGYKLTEVVVLCQTLESFDNCVS